MFPCLHGFFLPESSRARLSPGPPSSACHSSWRSVDLAAGCRRPRRRCSATRGRSVGWRWCGPRADLWGPRWAQTGRRGWWGRSGMQEWTLAPGSYTPSTELRGKCFFKNYTSESKIILFLIFKESWGLKSVCTCSQEYTHRWKSQWAQWNSAT